MATRTTTILYVQPVAERGGSDQAMLRLVRLLPDEVRVHVVAPSRHPLAPELEAAGAVVHAVPMRRITTSEGLGWWVRYALEWPLAVLRLALLARRVGADVVHTGSLHSWYGWAAALLVRRPHLWHAREITTQSGAALRLERQLTRRFAQLVVCMSEAIAAQLPGAATEVVLDDADRSEFRPGRAGSFRAAAGVPDDAPLVGAASRIDSWKGVEVALAAWPLVLARRPDARLVIAGGAVEGKQELYDRLEATADGLEGATWLGPRTDVPDLLADLDVLLALSTTPEPFGLSVVEALASGASVVATGAGGHVEIAAMADEGAVHLVPAGDAAATAEALVAALPPASSTAARRSRPVRLPPFPDQGWPERYRRLVAGGRRRP